jgi:2-oxoglutarate ferredoxin oxidoreductase subunit alpha
MKEPRQLPKATILFAGDSGDGIQLIGSQFSFTTALFGNDLSTYPDFPAEIRAPQGTVSGVSGFKINFGSTEIFTPGGLVDVLVVMNVAALIKDRGQLKPGGLILANAGGFDARNYQLAGQPAGSNALDEARNQGYQVIEVDVTALTRAALKGSGLGTRDQDRSRNMFMLGLVYWLFNREPHETVRFIKEKFGKEPQLLQANTDALLAGYHYGETAELADFRVSIDPAQLPAGTYRAVVGNQALALGLVAAAHQANLDLFYGSYPITPASDILHELARHKQHGVITFQAEDEIAAITSAIGASFAGALGTTGSSGPGMALKTEGLGLAVMLELPLVVVNIQRGGPSTGLPTKTEQADLFQALYGRNGEAPIPVLAAHTPSSCFDVAFTAARMAIEHMTPVIVLSDGYLGNGREPWAFPTQEQLPAIHPVRPSGEAFLPYARNAAGVRPWAVPGTPGLAHRIGGLEKQDKTGNISYDAENHEIMVKARAAKVAAIPVPPQDMAAGPNQGDVVVVGWGSTYGAIRVALENLEAEGVVASHIHLTYLNPLPANLGYLLKGFKHIVVPELNNGQLVHLLRDKYLVDAKPLNKIKGQPFLAAEIMAAIRETLQPVS